MTFSEVLRDRFWLRALVFLACVPSGGAVLTEVYGIASLHDVVWYAAVPGYLIVAAVWLIGRRGRFGDISQAIAIGAVGGFLGVIAYDVARIPFIFAGYRIFAQNASYGLWILGADYSTRFTTLAGWLYHFANGTLFGVMYAVFMRDRHWAWAIAWAFLLETIALTSPYGRIYHITTPILITVAYYGHVAYGLPLGFMTRSFEKSAKALAGLSPVYRITIAVMLAAAVLGPLFAPPTIAADRRAVPGAFTIEDQRLAPAWQRLRKAGSVTVRNPCDHPPAPLLVDGRPNAILAPCQQAVLPMPVPGVHLLALVPKGPRTRSSFVLVDPVSEAP